VSVCACLRVRSAGTLEDTAHALALVERAAPAGVVVGRPALYTTVGVHPTRAGAFETDAAALTSALRAAAVAGVASGHVRRCRAGALLLDSCGG
jgi:hypothetical protein